MGGTANMGTMVDRPRKCPGCGYNLIGLPTSGKCPECGGPLRGSSRDRDWLRVVPVGYLYQMWLGAWLLAGSAFVGAMVNCTQVVVAAFSITGAIGGVLGYVAMGASLAWYAGVWIVTSKIPAANIDTSSALSWVNRGLQFLLPVSVLAGILGDAPGGLAPGISGLLAVMAVVENAAFVVWVLSIAPFAWQLASLPKNAGDDGLGDRIRSCGIIVVLVLLYGVVTQLLLSSGGLGFLVGLVMGVLRLFVVIAGLVAIIVLLVGLFQLASMSRWAIKNRRHADEIEAEKAAAFERARRASVSSPAASYERDVPAARRFEPGQDIPLAASDGVSRVTHRSPGVARRERHNEKPEPGPQGDAMI